MYSENILITSFQADLQTLAGESCSSCSQLASDSYAQTTVKAMTVRTEKTLQNLSLQLESP
jgi:hypothetical protein